MSEDRSNGNHPSGWGRESMPIGHGIGSSGLAIAPYEASIQMDLRRDGKPTIHFKASKNYGDDHWTVSAHNYVNIEVGGRVDRRTMKILQHRYGCPFEGIKAMLAVVEEIGT